MAWPQEAIFVLFSVSLICLFFGESNPSPFLFFLIGPLIGFLLLNLPKAKIFMGDSGSIFLDSFSESCSCMKFVSIWCWLTLLGVFLVDGTSTAMVRFFRGQNLAKNINPFLSAFEQEVRCLEGFDVNSMLQRFWLLPMASLVSSIHKMGA